MGVETFSTLIASINRETNGVATPPEIQKAINDSLDFITNQTNWEFLLSQAYINLNPPYTTGTISITDQTNLVTLTGGTWDVTWQYKTLYIGSSGNVPYLISGITSPTTAVLATPVDIGSNTVNSSYTIFQDIYPLPAAMSYGRELMILNTQYRRRLQKPQRYSLENRNVYTRSWFSNYQYMYSDAGYNFTNKRYLVKLFPIPSTANSLVILYYQQIPYLVNDTDTTVLPREFDQIIVWLATSYIKMRYGMQGWHEAKLEGVGRLRDMRKMAQTGPAYDLYATSRSWPYAADSITDGFAQLAGPIVGGSM